MPSRAAAPVRSELLPALGPWSATALVVGAVIGSGIFFKPALIAQQLDGQLGWILGLWAVCGLVNLCGALAMAELAGMYPRAGGTYLFLREAYGRRWAFLWAWSEFWVIRSGSIAALAVYTAMSLTEVAGQLGMPVDESSRPLAQQLLAAACIAVLGGVNAAGVIWGGRLQNVMTAVKVATVAAIAVAPWLAESAAAASASPRAAALPGWTALGAALAAIMWAYDGWGNVTVVAEEMHDPRRDVPRSLVAGLVVLVLLYLGASWAYHQALSADEIAAAGHQSVAVVYWAKVWPEMGPRLMTGLLMVSTLGALNSNVLVGPRVLFALGRDHAAVGRLARVHPLTHTPLVAIALVCGWSIALVLLGRLDPDPDSVLADRLTNYCVFGGSIFYFTAVLAVFVLRRTAADLPRPYRTWGYPLVPAVFVVFYVCFLAGMLAAKPLESLAGLALIVLGAVAYRWLGENVAGDEAGAKA